MPPLDPAEVLGVRTFVDATKREIQQAERAYDVKQAAFALTQLARPLTCPHEFSVSWKRIYLDQFYRDVAKFVLTFVTAHLLPGFDSSQQRASFDVFFESPDVPALASLSVLMTQIAMIKPSIPSAASDESAPILTQSVRLLQRVLDVNGVRRIIDHLLQPVDDQYHATTGHRKLLTAQPIISSLCSVPDLVFNRLERSTPSCFAPRSFYALLSNELLDGVLVRAGTEESHMVFRLFAEKFARIGHMDDLVRAWLARGDLYEPAHAAAHARLIGALPVSAMESVLVQLATSAFASRDPVDHAAAVASSPQYRLLSLVPLEVYQNKQVQFVVAHKLLLAKPVRDPLVLRMLVKTLAGGRETSMPDPQPIHAVFEVIVNRWSGDAFPTSVDYALNYSITLFLRYAMRCMDPAAFVDQDWTMKLCKGVQHHMGHSVERVRVLGMRMGESVAAIMSPDHPLNFEIAERDPVEEYAHIQFDFSPRQGGTLGGGASHDDGGNGEHEQTTKSCGRATTKRSSTKKTKGVAFVDPDEIIESDEGEVEAEDSASDSGSDCGSDSDSETSLAAFDLHDDEHDLKPQRPVYLKDLLSGLHAEDDRDKTETALANAELLLRTKPKDLHYNATAVVTALLRLEDKYATPNFILLRSKALAAACALSPTASISYLQTQALQREQLLQSRIDGLQAMASAAYELSETGAFRPASTKHLLSEDLDARTIAGLKTRRFGYRRDPLSPAKKNAFGAYALAFFSPLVVGYVQYLQTLEGVKRLSEVEDVFLAHLLHALSTFVECAGHAPPAIPMAKALLAFAWPYRLNPVAAVRRQVLYACSRVVLVMPPFLLRQELGENVVEMMAWLQETNTKDPDDGCRDASRLLLSSGAVPILTMQ